MNWGRGPREPDEAMAMQELAVAMAKESSSRPMEEDINEDMDEVDPPQYINTGYDGAELMSQLPYDSAYE